ncbi:recombinase XerC [Sphingorhabdus lutea]|uniref:Tyrosine recombinase XerC n=1 Tax=Sphingorhabdus lutea TaxID=1913578 RepID=A0A1L3JF18_9SPHN|nr:tyrosine recombinase XerC [Sphingorhabdus lutea]APG63653.1 recombinase XerC [Sphingorhabdus lutea]
MNDAPPNNNQQWAQRIIADYQQFLALDRRRSVHTVRAYIITAQRFLSFVKFHFGDLQNITMLRELKSTDLRAYLASRRADGLANRSAARELSAVRSFLKFALGDDYILPILKSPKSPKTVPRPAAPDDIIALATHIRDGAKSPWMGKRDWALLMILYGAGLRISEALGIYMDQIPLGKNLRILGKGGKTRLVPIIPAVRDAVGDYIAHCPYKLHNKDPIFRGNNGGPLSPASIRKVVQHARRSLNLSDSLTPHALRHSFASHLLAGGADLRSLQELLGHASLSSTQIYTDVDTAMLLDVYKHAHPRG